MLVVFVCSDETFDVKLRSYAWVIYATACVDINKDVKQLFQLVGSVHFASPQSAAAGIAASMCVI